MEINQIDRKTNLGKYEINDNIFFNKNGPKSPIVAFLFSLIIASSMHQVPMDNTR